MSAQISMPGNLPKCTPPTAYYDQQLLSYSCFPGSVTIPNVNQVPLSPHFVISDIVDIIACSLDCHV